MYCVLWDMRWTFSKSDFHNKSAPYSVKPKPDHDTLYRNSSTALYLFCPNAVAQQLSSILMLVCQMTVARHSRNTPATMYLNFCNCCSIAAHCCTFRSSYTKHPTNWEWNVRPWSFQVHFMLFIFWTWKSTTYIKQQNKQQSWEKETNSNLSHSCSDSHNFTLSEKKNIYLSSSCTDTHRLMTPEALHLYLQYT